MGDEGRHGVILEVFLKDRRSYREKVLHAKGSDKNPMTRDEVVKKFRLLASHVLAPTKLEELEDTLLSLEKIKDASKIGNLLIP